jgi:hypothetical protein
MYLSVIQTSISPIPFIFISMHQIICWGQSSCRIKSKRTIAFYSQKLNTAQKGHATTETKQELLSDIEVKEPARNTRISYYVTSS